MRQRARQVHAQQHQRHHRTAPGATTPLHAAASPGDATPPKMPTASSTDPRRADSASRPGSGRVGPVRHLFYIPGMRRHLPSMTDYLARLNPEQREAVETVDGPLLVLAGAGTGKTRVLTTRFAHILLQGRASPGQVLAVTFTNKAAREMRERVGAILGRPAEGLWLGTFHALCARMLRRHAELVGLTSGFTILDTDDQLRLLKQVMEAARIDPKRWAPQALMAHDPALEGSRPDARRA